MKLEEQKEEYETFKEADRLFIARSLDIMRGQHPALQSSNLQEHAMMMAMQGIISKSISMKNESKTHPVFQNSNSIISPMVEIGIFALGRNCLQNFNAFRFLMERLFDDDYVPHIPSAYAAAAFSSALAEVPLEGFDDALSYHQQGYVSGTRDFMPTIIE